MISCEECKARLECLAVGMNRSLCLTAHRSLHAILIEFHKRVVDPAIIDVGLVETHMENVDTDGEVTIKELVVVELVGLTNGDWQVESRWHKKESIADDGTKSVIEKSSPW